ncbi:sensor histidine kinase [Streptomyces sp. NPDC059816]|uniref:sensor histidine kinase n=1 Tax=Streptomyces sp. NPDC059816 TaxID=3346960 RepID=UPI00366532D9
MPQDGPVEPNSRQTRARNAVVVPEPSSPAATLLGTAPTGGAVAAAGTPTGRASRARARLARGWHLLCDDRVLAALTAVTAVVIAFFCDRGTLDALGWSLLLAAHVPLVFRTRAPLGTLLAVIALVAPYHSLDYDHTAPGPVTYLALYTVAVTGTFCRTVCVGLGTLGLSMSVMLAVSPHEAMELLRISGWVVAILVVGAYVRVHRGNVRAAHERAERAERTREEEARRRVAEERLRIARDLHDLLAHTITLIGVQTSVAAHVLAADPDRLDRTAVARALDDIADTCRAARGELRTTLEVLRADAPGDPRGPLPGLGGLPDLVEAARSAGAEVTLTLRGVDVQPPPAVGAAAYRIVQEALTNAVRHAGPGVAVTVAVRVATVALEVTVTDDGAGAPDPGPAHPAAEPTTASGFGLIGMRERARSVGGTLEAGPRPTGGFTVTALLPLVPVAQEGTLAPVLDAAPARVAVDGPGRPWQGLDPGESPA